MPRSRPASNPVYMKAERSIAVLVILAALIPALWAAMRPTDEPRHARQPEVFKDAHDVLRGLQGVYVEVAPLNPGVEQVGLTQETFRTDTELQLRQRGIRALSLRDRWETPGQTRLFVTVHVLGAALTTGMSCQGIYKFSATNWHA